MKTIRTIAAFAVLGLAYIAGILAWVFTGAAEQLLNISNIISPPKNSA
jgi:hypothetical protein